jgi:hypothetical protein
MIPKAAEYDDDPFVSDSYLRYNETSLVARAAAGDSPAGVSDDSFTSPPAGHTSPVELKKQIIAAFLTFQPDDRVILIWCDKHCAQYVECWLDHAADRIIEGIR